MTHLCLLRVFVQFQRGVAGVGKDGVKIDGGLWLINASYLWTGPSFIIVSGIRTQSCAYCKDVIQKVRTLNSGVYLIPLIHSFIHWSIEAAFPTHFVYIVPSCIEWHHSISFVFVGWIRYSSCTGMPVFDREDRSNYVWCLYAGGNQQGITQYPCASSSALAILKMVSLCFWDL